MLKIGCYLSSIVNYSIDGFSQSPSSNINQPKSCSDDLSPKSAVENVVDTLSNTSFGKNPLFIARVGKL
jgi:hypothetical protein